MCRERMGILEDLLLERGDLSLCSLLCFFERLQQDRQSTVHSAVNHSTVHDSAVKLRERQAACLKGPSCPSSYPAAQSARARQCRGMSTR